MNSAVTIISRDFRVQKKFMRQDLSVQSNLNFIRTMIVQKEINANLYSSQFANQMHNILYYGTKYRSAVR